MTASEFETIDTADLSAIAEGQSIREYLGLEIKHLLPGLDIAANLLRSGKHEEALKTYATLILCDPNEIRFQIGLATCALEIGQFHLAILAASGIVAEQPENPLGYLISGRASLGLREFEAAINDLEHALGLARESGDEAAAQEASTFLERTKIAQELRSMQGLQLDEAGELENSPAPAAHSS